MISVITPFWNSELWLERCCESMHSQEGDFEFILVDDKSTDGGWSIAQKYKILDDRFVVIGNEHDKGVSGARNTGIDHARGEWITFLDADDELLDGAYRAFQKAIKANMQANVIQLNHERYYQKLGRGIVRYCNDAGVYCIPDLPEIWVGVWSKLFRAEFLDGIRFLEGMQYGEDGLFVLECMARDGRIFHADRNLLAIRHRFDNENSLSHVKKLSDIVGQIREYESFMERQTDPMLKKLVCMDLSKLWMRAARRIK